MFAITQGSTGLFEGPSTSLSKHLFRHLFKHYPTWIDRPLNYPPSEYFP